MAIILLQLGEEFVARWPGSILADSGGFPVISLVGIRKIRERGVIFALTL